MKTLKINITKRDIQRGEKSISFACPIARATLRKIKCKKLEVGIGRILVWDSDDFIKKISLSKIIQEFINRFDMGLKVKPQKFIINY